MILDDPRLVELPIAIPCELELVWDHKPAIRIAFPHDSGRPSIDVMSDMVSTNILIFEDGLVDEESSSMRH